MKLSGLIVVALAATGCAAPRAVSYKDVSVPVMFGQMAPVPPNTEPVRDRTAKEMHVILLALTLGFMPETNELQPNRARARAYAVSELEASSYWLNLWAYVYMQTAVEVSTVPLAVPVSAQ